MITEADVKDEIKTYLKEIGAWYYMPVPSGYGRNSIPDFIICYRGFFLAPEAKRPPEGKEKDPEGTAGQQLEIEAIQRAGGLSIVVWSVDHVRALVAEVDRRLGPS